MVVWPFRKKSSIPSYSLLDAEPCRGVPKGLSDREASSDFDATVERIRADLLSQPPDFDADNFAIFITFGDGLLQLQVPEGRCLLVFSSRVRAADYIRVQVPDRADQLGFFVSTARNAANVIPHFREHAAIDAVALDRCPRCNIFACLDPDAMNKPENLIGAWAISISREIGRRDLYWSYARNLAREGELVQARNLALELIGHVTPHDVKTHLLIGKLAIRLNDRKLLREAKRYLEFLGAPRAATELHALERGTDWQF